MKEEHTITVNGRELPVVQLRDALHAEALADALLRERDTAVLLLSHLLPLHFDNERARRFHSMREMEPIPSAEILQSVPRHQLRLRKHAVFEEFYRSRLN
ncbi:hypothetical protein [Desulfolutivibrio sulfoxidireducens]|uniref:hypothetical protein n=1 Tax=Desulfolutivibrio sulfoxidireducens TaxID=2773299 RepID=UPI00159E5AED|nr:hypothetical protein [Desulfolutivibrio sulfoxidireducens]QLA16648.1 hypothetical protein GD605_11250 [Desulfolutivibrio sulfoxidireducens]QLA19473.1 hypothetical protein GD604_06815 [Desulfolutivibrio sulfoxidireducens]